MEKKLQQINTCIPNQLMYSISVGLFLNLNTFKNSLWYICLFILQYNNWYMRDLDKLVLYLCQWTGLASSFSWFS